MKRFLAISMGLLLAVCASAQYVSDRPVLKTKGSRIYAYGVKLDKAAAAACFSDMNGADRSGEYLKDRTAYKAGLGLTIGGASAVVVGSLTSLVGLAATAITAPFAALGGENVPKEVTGATIAGVSVMCVGVAALAAGIPTMCVYRSRIRKMAEDHNSLARPKAELSFGGQSSGVGFALNF